MHQELGGIYEDFVSLKRERQFLDECIQIYVSRQPNSVSSNPVSLSETIIQPKSTFTIHPKYFEPPVIDTIPECQTSSEDSSAPSDLMDRPKSDSFIDCFIKVLTSKYEHLSEEHIFGNSQESSSEVVDSVIINDFDNLNKCVTVQEVLEFFTCWVQSSSVQEELKTELNCSLSVLCKETDSKTIQRLIWDQVEIFCYYLINSRTETMHHFEEFERVMYKYLISFQYLSSDSSSFKTELEEVLNLFETNIVDGCTPTTTENVSLCDRVIDIIKHSHFKCSLACTKEAEARRMCVYEQEKSLYQKLLEVIEKQIPSHNRTELLNQFLDSNANHFSYFFENLVKLVKVLTQVIEPYKFVSQRRDDSNVYSIQMQAGLSSHALSALYEWISKQPSKTVKAGDEVRFCADAVLYMDKDITLNSVSIVCIAPQVICKKEPPVPSSVDKDDSCKTLMDEDDSGKTLNDCEVLLEDDDCKATPYDDSSHMLVSINTNGKPTELSEHQSTAQSGEDGTELDKNGKHGHDGINGHFGNAGGHILIVGSKVCFDNFNLSAVGSRGEDGQNGGNGGDGWTSSVISKDGHEPDFEHGRLKTSSSVVISFGSSGAEGGCGGNAGMGGAAGKGGVCGKVEIIDLEDELNCQESQEPSIDGNSGQPGNPGKGGKHTRNGKDFGKYGKQIRIISLDMLEKLITSKRPASTVSHRKGELSHDEITYDTSVPHKEVEVYEKPAKNKPIKVIKNENHPDFVDGFFNDDGENAETKINNAIANENKAVNKQACFHLLSEQCRSSLQHWNCKSHKKCLGSFAHKIGEFHHSDLFIVTHSKLNISKCALWISRIQKHSEQIKVSVTYEAKHKTKAKVSMMKNYVENAKYPSAADDTCFSDEAVHIEPLVIDVSSLKKRSQNKGMHLKNIPLESLLLDLPNCELEKLQLNLCLSKEHIYFIAFESSCGIEAYSECFKFLIAHNLRTDGWVLYHSSASYKMTESLSLKNLTVSANQPYQLNREDVSYKDIVEWICENVKEDIELPADLEQLCCLKKIEVIIRVRKSYEIYCARCDFKKLNLVQKVFAIFLDQVVASKSLSNVFQLEKSLQSHSLLCVQVNFSMVEDFLGANPSTCKLKLLSDAINCYNREHKHEFLLNVLVEFHKCHLKMLKTSDYVFSLTQPKAYSFLQAFQRTVVDACQFLCGNIDIPFRLQDIAVIPTSSESILQEIPIKTRKGNQTYSHLKVYLDFILQNEEATPVDKMLRIVVNKIANLLGLEVESLNRSVTHTAFLEAYTAFCASPCLETALPAIVVYSESAISDEMEQVLLHLHSHVKLLLEGFHELLSIVDFKSSLTKVGLDTNNFIQALSRSPIRSMPQVKSLNYILEQVQNIDPDCICPKSDISSVNPSVSEYLIFIMSFLQSMFSYCNSLFYFRSDTNDSEEDLQEKIEKRNDIIENYIQQAKNLHSNFLNYPMSCPIQALIKWKEFMKSSLIPKIETKIKLFSTKNDEILIKLKPLKNVTESLYSYLDHIIAIRERFLTFQNCRDLQTYSCSFDSGSNIEQQLLPTVMDWITINPECVKTMVHHFAQNFLSRKQHKLFVKLERLQPKYEFFITCEDYPTAMELHTVVLVIGAADWKLSYTSDTKTSRKRDVKPDEIEQIQNFLPLNFDEMLMKDRCYFLTAEQKSHLLSFFQFEEYEYIVSYTVHFGQQLLVDKTNCTLCTLSINIETCEVKLLKESVLEQGDTSILVILCNCTCVEALEALRSAEYLEISEEQFDIELKDSVAAMIVKYPDQLPIIKTVTKCGEKETLEHWCSLAMNVKDMSLISLLANSSEISFQMSVVDNPENISDPLVSVLQPLSDFLKNYHQLYGSLLHFSILNSCLKSALDKCPKVCFYKDIINLVRIIRQDFLQKCISEVIIDQDHKNLVTLRFAVNEEMFSESVSGSIKDIYHIALEYFLFFELVMVAKKNEIKAIREAQWTFKFWEKAIIVKKLTTEDVCSLCSAFVYLMDNLYFERLLDNEPPSVIYKAYQSTLNGLELLPANMVTKELKSKVRNHLKVSNLEQSINSENYDESIYDLLEIIKTNQSFEQFLSSHLSTINISGNQLCQQISQIFFQWFNDQLGQIFQQLQDILTSNLCSNFNEKESLMSEFCTAMYAVADEAIESPVEWDSLAELIQIGNWLVQDINDQMQKFLGSASDSSNFLQSRICFIQLLKVSPDVSRVLSVIQEVPSELWLKYLLAYNLFSQFENLYSKIDILYEKLLDLDQTFLMIFYNTFLNDVHNVRSTNNSASPLLSSEQLVVIVDLLSNIEPCSSAFSALCRMSIILWDQELPKIHLKQYLDHWKDLSVADKQRTVHMLNRVRLDSELTHRHFMSLLYEIRSKFIRSKKTDSASLMSLIDHIYYKQISLDDVKHLTTSSDYRHWNDCMTAIENKTVHSVESRDADSVLELIENQTDTELSKRGIVAIKKEVKEFYKNLEYCSLVPNATKRELKYFLSLFQTHVTVEDKLNWLEKKNNRVHFVSMLVKCWILSSKAVSYSESPEVPYSTQIVSLFLFLHSKEEGLLQQVKTGEGKTLIVGMLAGAKALIGFKVDVVSSNRDLAQSGMEKCELFFSLLGLKGAINCTDDEDTNKQSYKAHIVYGDVSSFQHDRLRHESEPNSDINFKNRYLNLKNNCLIVDEVDSMFLDKARHMLYLSHDSPALKHLESLFLHIWSAVVSLPSLSNLQLEEVTKNLIVLVENDTIQVPKYLKEFCKTKMKSWVQSANHAKSMDANDQFVIDYQKQRKSDVKQIFPIDKQTGIEQYNMRWTDGLSQFLELRYRRPMSSESLKAIFISNKRFFQMYETRLFGLSGTLGSVVSRGLLSKVYDIQTVELPTNKPKRYSQMKSRIGTDEQLWCVQIYTEISLRTSEQPILIICENIKQLECIKRYILSQGKINEADIISYARDGDNVEKVFKSQEGAKPRQIVMATNKGGRGTDIIINNKQVPKGLHVILTFLAENTRIEEQAFGRAARAGQTGSGCLVIEIDPCEHLSLLKDFDTIEAGTEVIVEREKTKRNNFEADRLVHLQNNDLPKLELEEKLYLMFQTCKNKFQGSLDNFTFMTVKLNKSAKKALLLILADCWAYWLDSMHNRIYSTSSECERREITDLFNKSFPAKGYPLPASIDDSAFFKHPEHYITLGIGFIEDIECLEKSTKPEQEQRQIKAALACFDRASEIGDKTGFAAMASCYCFIKLNKIANQTNMKQARRYLKKAKSHLTALKQTFMANAEIGSTLYKLINVSQYIHDDENYYCHQIEEKLKVLGLHLHTVELLLGNSIDEYSFIRESPVSEEKISEQESKNIYHSLVAKGIVCQNKVRKCWKKNEDALRSLMLDKVDEQLCDSLIKLVIQEPVINEYCLDGIVHGSDELWDIISPLLEPSVRVKVIFVKKVEAVAFENKDLGDTWSCFKNKFDTDPIVLPWDDSSEISLSDCFKSLLLYLEEKDLCESSRRGSMTSESLRKMETLQLLKYEQCTICDDAGHKQPLRKYLLDLFEYCQQHEDGNIYEYMLPYESKENEVKKIHTFFRHEGILKSGQLVKYKYEAGKQFESALKDLLKNDYSTDKTEFILQILSHLHGKIRSFERDIIVNLVDFDDLPDRPDDVPEELQFFEGWYMTQFLSIEQAGKGWWDWNAFACGMLGLAQVITGAVLMSAGFTAILGEGLIVEGLNDMMYATMAGLTGTFSWKDYMIQKSISLALTILTGGLSALAGTVKVAAKLGSATPFRVFMKTMAKAGKKFILNAATSIVTDIVLDKVQERIVEALVTYIEDKILSNYRENLQSHLISLAQSVDSDDEFHHVCQRNLQHLKSSLDTNPLLSPQLNTIRCHVASSLQSTYKGIADNMGSSSTARLITTSAKVAYYSNKAILQQWLD